jgi:tetratricopeptide (TPR) repeat protein
LNGYYAGEVESALEQDITLAIAANRPRVAVATTRRLQALAPDDSRHSYLLAEAYRLLGPLTPEPGGEELTEKGRNDARKRRGRLTPQEERTALLATPAGRAAQEQNHREAEKWYRRALELDPLTYEAYRGLGLLFEEKQPADAIAAFEQYLALASDARDRSQVLRRLEILRGTVSKQSSGKGQ